MVENKIDNCELYVADKKCRFCKANFFLTNETTCDARNTSLNCATHINKDSCKTCPAEYKLVTNSSTSNNSCQKVTVPANCTIYDVNNSKCLICAQYHYINADGTCTKVAEDLITNCLVMASATTCK